MPLYLIQFVHEQHWVDFRGAELQCLLAMEGVHIEVRPTESMLLLLDIPAHIDQIHRVCSRAVLVKAIYTLISSSSDLSSIVTSQDTITYLSSLPHTSSWSLTTETLNRSLSNDQKERVRSLFKGTYPSGPIQIKEPEVDLRVVAEFPWTPVPTTTTTTTDDSIDGIPPHWPCYFCRLLAKGGMKEAIKKYDLRTRIYVGPTSLDHTLALIIANIANLSCGQLVFDPFVGTASILIAASHHGAHCYGSDIDIRVLKGDMYAGQDKVKRDRRDIFGSFDSYALPRPELLRMVRYTICILLCDA
jgi:tRNA (guanine10-N2)-methyltransferase